MKTAVETPAKRAPRETLNLRIPAAERSLIDRAAKSSAKTRTDFILSAARRAAEEELLDRARSSSSARPPTRSSWRCSMRLRGRTNACDARCRQQPPGRRPDQKPTIQPPEPLSAEHALGDFDSGVVSLDDWLKQRALQNQASGASRTFVVCDAGKVVAYYALAASAANRVIHAADTIGIRGRLVHAISEQAKAFYVGLGLDPSPLEPMTLMTTVAVLEATMP